MKQLPTIDTARLRLDHVIEMRTFDFLSNTYLPLVPGEGNICDRCTREHARVYVIEDLDTHKQYHVGSTCCKRMFTSWQPDKDEVKEAERQARYDAFEAAKWAVVNQLLAQVLAMDLGDGDLFELQCKAVKRLVKTLDTDPDTRRWLSYQLQALLSKRMREGAGVKVLETETTTQSQPRSYKLTTATMEPDHYICLDCEEKRGHEEAIYILQVIGPHGGESISGLCLVHAIEWAWQHGMDLPALDKEA